MPEAITDNLDLWSSALLTKSTAGRGSNGKLEAYGIKKLRELILELAVRGKLLPQDPRDEPADLCLTKARLELRAKGKGARRSAWKETALVSEDDRRFDLPKGWTWARVNDTGFYINGLAFKPADWGESGKPIIRIQNLTDRSKPLNCAQGEFPDEVTVRTGDLLVSWSATLDAFIWDRGEAVLNQHIFRVIPCHELVIPGFHYWLLKVSIREMEESDHAHGLVMTHINRDPFLAHVVAIPPLAEQHRIVAKVDELMALCDQLEQQQTRSIEAHQTLVASLLGTLTRVELQQEFSVAWARIASHFDTLFTTEASIDQLKQTILQLAVMGKLVPQDPDDESATVLLKNIAEEQDRLAKEGKIKKPKELAKIADDEKPFELPKGWEYVRLNDLGEWGAGATPSRGRHEYYGGNIPWFKSGELVADFISESEEHVTALALKETSLRYNKPGDVLIAMYGATIGKTSILNVAATTNQAVCACTPFTGFSNVFLLTLLKAFKGRFIDMGAGGAQPNISREKIIATVIALPPTQEQHRIVAKVDELMALCDSLKARIKDAQAIQLHLADAIVEQAVC